MGWKDLLQKEDEKIVRPWIGGREVREGARTWTITGRLPQEHGWYQFTVEGRKVRLASFEKDACEVPPGSLRHPVRGYLVGDRLVPDDATVDPDPAKIAGQAEQVFLLDDGLDRFVRVLAGRTHEDGPLVFEGQEMPLGPEEEVLRAFLDQRTDVRHVPGVTPALDAAFRMETWQRAEAEKRRVEAERRRREEEERRALEERRQKLVEQLGDGAGRRAMALQDFGEAAKAALAMGGATYLDHRRSARRNETVVRFRLDNRRFECTCDSRTLQIVDAGICLNAHYDDPDFEEGTKGDAFFTLESLPAVIRQAQREGKLVVFRHVD
jgi:hypothetical protein